MKCFQARCLTVLLCGVALGAHADVIINQSAGTTPNQAPATVIVPTPVQSASAVPAPVAVVTDLDREGDWYVVAGTADLDRFHTILRVKDDKHGWVTIAYRDGVEIYRHGQRISYMDVNPGEEVTVRFKNS